MLFARRRLLNSELVVGRDDLRIDPVIPVRRVDENKLRVPPKPVVPMVVPPPPPPPKVVMPTPPGNMPGAVTTAWI